MRIKILLSFSLAIISTITFAQQRAISGSVQDDAGIPLPGATVIVQDTNRGVTTAVSYTHLTLPTNREV